MFSSHLVTSTKIPIVFSDSIKRRTAEMETELKYELDTLRQTESELQQGRNRINEIRTMVQSETTSVGKNSKIVSS